AGSGGVRYLRARLQVPEFARAVARLEGERIYVDLTWPGAAEIVPRSVPAAVAAAAAPPRARPRVAPQPPAGPAPAAARADRRPASMEPLREAVARFAEIAPFLLSTAAAPSPDILGALDTSVAALEASLKAMDVPRDAAAGHGMLIAAAAAARRSLAS